jgi:hypothetical protein
MNIQFLRISRRIWDVGYESTIKRGPDQTPSQFYP